jgi:hypothetical protein
MTLRMGTTAMRLPHGWDLVRADRCVGDSGTCESSHGVATLVDSGASCIRAQDSGDTLQHRCDTFEHTLHMQHFLVHLHTFFLTITQLRHVQNSMQRSNLLSKRQQCQVRRRFAKTASNG